MKELRPHFLPFLHGLLCYNCSELLNFLNLPTILLFSLWKYCSFYLIHNTLFLLPLSQPFFYLHRLIPGLGNSTFPYPSGRYLLPLHHIRPGTTVPFWAPTQFPRLSPIKALVTLHWNLLHSFLHSIWEQEQKKPVLFSSMSRAEHSSYLQIGVNKYLPK
jgi:hypothetical protein